MADLVDLEDMQFYLCQISRFSCLLKNLGEPIISYMDRLFHSQQAITRNAPEDFEANLFKKSYSSFCYFQI